MKADLLPRLRCPECEGHLTLTVETTDGDEVMDGRLRCESCSREHAIRRGVPRLLRRGLSAGDEKTKARFGSQWSAYAHLTPAYEQQFLGWVTPLTRQSFRGRTVLEGGCGKGRHTVLVQRFGAREVIGIDLSSSVDVAFDNAGRLPGVHIIQADVTRLPLAGGFDIVFSVGVLHHLADGEAGFRELASSVAPGGRLSVWVYAREGNGWVVHLIDPLRKLVTSRLPVPVLKWLCWPVGALLYLVVQLIFRPLHRAAPRLASRLYYGEYLLALARLGLRDLVLIVLDHLQAPVARYMKRDAVRGWFERTGLVISSQVWHHRNSWAVLGERPGE